METMTLRLDEVKGGLSAGLLASLGMAAGDPFGSGTPCPTCNGSGMTSYGGDCGRCGGSGELA